MLTNTNNFINRESSNIKQNISDGARTWIARTSRSTDQLFRQLGHDNTRNQMVLIVGIENAGIM